jgi:hypothetical protein
MTARGAALIQVSAAKVSTRLPGGIAVGSTELEVGAERTSTGGSGSKRFAARWTKGTISAGAYIDIRPASKTTTDISVTLERPKGAQAFLWPRATLRRLEQLLAQALAYEIETRSIEEASAFGIRRTSPELVRSRAS